jgi:uncharacterized protein
LLENSNVDDIDYTKVIALYKKASELEEPNAMHNLGLCYFNGDGVQKDLSKAYEYFFRAANLGHAESMFKIGWSYLEGDGLSQSKTEAIQWLDKAKVCGHDEAEQLLEKLNKH